MTDELRRLVDEACQKHEAPQACISYMKRKIGKDKALFDAVMDELLQAGCGEYLYRRRHANARSLKGVVSNGGSNHHSNPSKRGLSQLASVAESIKETILDRKMPDGRKMRDWIGTDLVEYGVGLKSIGDGYHRDGDLCVELGQIAGESTIGSKVKGDQADAIWRRIDRPDGKAKQPPKRKAA